MKIAIIGGSGKMGRWLARFLLKDDKEVVITGRNQNKLLEAKQQLGVEVATNIEAVKNSDVVVLSVPIDNFEEVVKEVSPYTHSGQIIVDITSLKVFPVETMHRYIRSGVVLGTHPMFGPGAKDMYGQNFVLTPTNEEERTLAQKVKEYLEAKGARISIISPEEHDEIMAIVLGLAHFIAIASADTLFSFDKFERASAIRGTTYSLLLMLVRRVISEDPEFYASLQMNMPNLPEIEKLFQEKVKTWADLVKNKDRQKFVERMNSLKNRFKEVPDSGKSYENIHQLMEGL